MKAPQVMIEQITPDHSTSDILEEQDYREEILVFKYVQFLKRSEIATVVLETMPMNQHKIYLCEQFRF